MCCRITISPFTEAFACGKGMCDASSFEGIMRTSHIKVKVGT